MVALIKKLLNILLSIIKKDVVEAVIEAEEPIEDTTEPLEEIEIDNTIIVEDVLEAVIEPVGRDALTFIDCDANKVATLIKEYSHFKTTYKGITVHNNGNTKSTAQNDVDYALNKRYKNDGYDASWHYSVDDTEVIRFVPWGYTCWAAGDGSKGYGNSETLNIEINEFNGYTDSSDEKWIKARENAVHLIAQICVDMNWSVDAVGQHYDRSGKNCPRVIRKEGWNEFLIDINKMMTKIKEQ